MCLKPSSSLAPNSFPHMLASGVASNTTEITSIALHVRRMGASERLSLPSTRRCSLRASGRSTCNFKSSTCDGSSERPLLGLKTQVTAQRRHWHSTGRLPPVIGAVVFSEDSSS